MRPRFLQALDNVDATDNGYLADCPICRDILLIEPGEDHWQLGCDGGHLHQELVDWLQLTDLRVNPAHSTHAWVCLMLATTADIWAALLAGEPVNQAALDQAWLTRFRSAGIVP